MKYIIALFLILCSSVGLVAANPVYSATLLKKAQNGDAQAQNDLAECYQYGYGVETDYEKALEWYDKSAAQNNKDALFNMGIFFLNGVGGNLNCQEGLNYLEQAKLQGHNEAQQVINEVCNHGEEMWGNYVISPYFYVEAPDIDLIKSKQNELKRLSATSPSANFYLGLLAEYEDDFKTALDYFIKARDLFYPDGKYDYDADKTDPLTGGQPIDAIEAYLFDRLGYYYEYGLGCDVDYDKAIKYYQSSEVRDGYFPLLGAYIPDLRTAMCYKKAGQTGEYIKKLQAGNFTNEENESTGISYSSGCPMISLWLADAYYKGDGVSKDYKKAFDLFENVIESEIWGLPLYETYPDIYADACWRMYQMYQNGKGIDKSFSDAKAYFEEAVKYGSYPALQEYAVMLNLLSD